MRHVIATALLLAASIPLATALPAATAQSQEEDPARFNYFVNDWNVVGLKDYERARITPDNHIMLAGKNTVVRVRDGQKLTPLAHSNTKTLMDGWLPIMEIAADDGPVHYEFTYWATPMPDVKDWRKAYDWPTEGENFLVWAGYKAVNTSNKPGEAKVDIRIDPKAAYPDAAGAPPEPEVNVSLHGSCRIDKDLPPGGSIEGAARFAFFPVKNAASLDKEDFKLWLQRTADYWRGVEMPLAKITVPCRKATDALCFATSPN